MYKKKTRAKFSKYFINSILLSVKLIKFCINFLEGILSSTHFLRYDFVIISFIYLILFGYPGVKYRTICRK